MIVPKFLRSRRLSADPPGEPPAAAPAADLTPVDQLVAEAAVVLANRDDTYAAIEHAERQAAADKIRIATLERQLDALSARYASLVKSCASGSTAAAATLAAVIGEQVATIHAQANEIAHLQAALADRAPVRLGGWQC
jgi:hypothetical protein